MEYDVSRSIDSQERLCKERDLPLFAPHNGICYRCHEQIYEKKESIGWQGRKYTTGITTEKAGKSLVTGCPHCNYSFCE